MKKNKKKAIFKKQNVTTNDSVVRFLPTITEGLSSQQVAERKSQKLTNITKVKSTKSYASIFFKNICTFFNLLWLAIAIALLWAQAYKDLIFIVVVVLNTAIAIFQEIRAKITVEKLSIVTAPRVRVIREGKEELIPSEQIVLDDVIVLGNGDQVPADSIILEGDVEVNESLLTGESVPILKGANSPLLSGSFLVSGKCYARVDKVGKENYVWQMAQRAKEFKAPNSNLFKDLRSLIKYISIVLVPIGILTYLKERIKYAPAQAIIDTAGAVTGMIPAGMFLLITIGLAVGVIKLSRKKTLVKDLYSIEMLARTNVLCLDKTGTITDGTMNVVEFVIYGRKRNASVKKILTAVLHNQKSLNSTSSALIKEFGNESTVKATNILEFSSQRKYSITELNGKCYFLGSHTNINCILTNEQKEYIASQQKNGIRVIVLAESLDKFDKDMTGKNAQVIAIISLEEHIRKDAVETIEWFKNNGVEIKIISGDDPATVSKIAQRVGVENSDKFISLENVSLAEVEQFATQFTVFGRVTPEQKYTLVKALKKSGNVVAMTGDGVNDTLALKEADCSIAMADGSEVARSISKLVLLGSDFTALPSVVKEGRQVINNVQSSSGLFVMKNIFAILMCMATLIFNLTYPLRTQNMFMIELFVIGIPSFILTFEPNNQKIKGNFIPQVLKRSIPRALLMFVGVFIIVLLYREGNGVLSYSEYKTLLVLTLTFTGVINLATLYLPFTWIRAGTIVSSILLIVLAIVLMGNFFMVTNFSFIVLETFFTIILSEILLCLIIYANRRGIQKLKEKFIELLQKE